MKSNIKAIRKCPTFKKEFISFDKKGKKVVTVKEVSDCYLVVLANGSSVALTKEQLKEYGIRGALPDTNETIIPSKATTVDIIEEDLDEDDDEVVTNVTPAAQTAKPTATLTLNPTNTTVSNSPIVIK